MKMYTLILITLFSYKFTTAQLDIKTIPVMLGELNQPPNDSVKSYTLRTHPMYKTDDTVKIFNYFISETEIILFSVFPVYKHFINNYPKEKWIPLEEKYKNRLVYKQQIAPIFRATINRFFNNPYEVNDVIKAAPLIPVVSINGKLFRPAGFNLAELFVVENQQTIFPNESRACVINTFAKPLLYQDYFQKKLAFVPETDREKYLFHYNREGSTTKFEILPGIFRANDTIINKNAIHRFWTLTNYYFFVADYFNYVSGIDRFAYIPGKGIVGGLFGFYFSFLNLGGPGNSQYLNDNPMMYAEELKQPSFNKRPDKIIKLVK